jgi:hypothetical protein
MSNSPYAIPTSVSGAGEGTLSPITDAVRAVGNMPLKLVGYTATPNVQLLVGLLVIFSMLWFFFGNPFTKVGDALAKMGSALPGEGFSGHARFVTGRSDTGAETSMSADIDRLNTARGFVSSGGVDGFLNGRDAPYFPDVTNNVLRRESREKAAVRALGKINQERMRRASAEDNGSGPLAWGTFWSEWKATHPLDSDVEAFSEDDLIAY